MSPLPSLTATELRVLAALADHGTYRDAAAKLLCSAETVKSHMSTVRVKLGALNTTNAVAIGIRRGLI